MSATSIEKIENQLDIIELVDMILSFPEDKQNFIIHYLMTCLQTMKGGY